MDGVSKTVIIKVGGSILCPNLTDTFNFPFAIEFREKILHPYISKGYKFVLTIGGGKLARRFQSRQKEFSVSNSYLHKTGIIATLMNAVCFQSIIPKIAHPQILSLNDYLHLFKFVNSKTFENSGVLLSCGGYRQESSTDLNAVLVAMRLGVNKVISIKNIDGIYSDDPKIFKSARLIEKMNWNEYFEIINNAKSHNPGDSWPIDPVAAKQAMDNKMEFVVIGSDLENLKRVIDGGNFVGSVVK